MGDINAELLESIGWKPRKAQSHPKRFREGNNDSSDSDEGKHPRKKPSGAQIPVKKRFDLSETDAEGEWDDDDDQQSGDESDNLSLGSDLNKNDEVEEEWTELRREMRIYERNTKMDDYQLKKKARAASGSRNDQKMHQDSPQQESPPLPSSRSRWSSRNERNAASKSEILNGLRAKRMKQPDEGNRKTETLGGGAGFSAKEGSPPKHGLTSIADNSDSDSGDNVDGDKSDGEDDGASNADDEDPTSTLAPKYEDVKAITLQRAKLAKLFMEPFFEDIVAGCFVRVSIGSTRHSSKPQYRLCIIRNIDSSEPDRHYKFEGYTTLKYLNCVWGTESSAARWPMTVVSDSEPTETEFKDWLQEVQRMSGRMPSHQEINERKDAIQKTNNFVYSAATVKQMLQEKKSASSRPVNVAVEKDKLRKAMESAELKNDEAEMERIRARLKELEEISRLKKMDDKAIKLAEMNRKNRAENFKNASEMKPVNTSLKAGEAGYDPFSRRWTRSRNYYVSKPGGDGNGGVLNGDANGTALSNGSATSNGNEAAGMEATTAALEAAADAGKLVDTSAPVDMGTESNSLHDFDLPISLAIKRVEFLTKKQRIEATAGFKVPDNDERRHSLTLTVSDYKRRRGLL